MLTISNPRGRKQNLETNDPSNILTVTLTVEPDPDCDEFAQKVVVDMEIESLNNSTRDHQNPDDQTKKCANLQIFHMMCEKANRNDQMTVLNAIACNPRCFYNQLVLINPKASGCASPLSLFPDSENPPFDWSQVQNSLVSARESIRSVFRHRDEMMLKAKAEGIEYTDDVNTPCYAMMVSQDPNTTNLMDATMTSVIHPPPIMPGPMASAPPRVKDETKTEG